MSNVIKYQMSLVKHISLFLIRNPIFALENRISKKIRQSVCSIYENVCEESQAIMKKNKLRHVSEVDEDRHFNITLGLEPMNNNTFKYIVEGILKEKCFGDAYLSVAYNPVRDDKISCVQAYRINDSILYHTEVIISDDNERGYKILFKEDMSLMETISVFRIILVYYQTPPLLEWEELTDF